MPTRYSPVRHCQGLPQPCDLHVLSMPPAFALSQDQTLRFISTPSHTAKAVQPAISTNRPSTHLSQDPSIIPTLQASHPSGRHHRQTHKRNCNASKRYNSHAPYPSNRPTVSHRAINLQPKHQTQSHSRNPAQDAADVSLPQPIHLSKSQSRKHQTPAQGGQSGQLALLYTPSGADREG